MQKIYPFKFLNPYTKADKGFFFGREDEIEELYKMVFQTKILLVYGASGTGKTSLIQCGLANRFQSTDWHNIYVRKGKNISESFRKEIDKEIQNTTSVKGKNKLSWLKNIKKKTQTPEIITEASTPTATAEDPDIVQVRRLYQQVYKPLYVIFDQFEELFTLQQQDEEGETDYTEEHQFITLIDKLLTSDIPVTFIIVMREEYLANLSNFEEKVPTLLDKKFRVSPMNRHTIQRVITEATGIKNSLIHLEAPHESEIAKTIVQKIRDKKQLFVQLPYLQVFMDKLYETAVKKTQTDADIKERTHEATYTLDMVKDMKTITELLSEVLDNQVKNIEKTVENEQLPEDMIWLLLSPFATTSGTKIPIIKAELLQAAYKYTTPKVAQTVVETILRELTKSQILRKLEEDDTYELAHDTLALEIAERRSSSETTRLKTLKILDDRLEAFDLTGSYLTEKEIFLSYSVHPDELKPEIKAFVRESQDYLDNKLKYDTLEQFQGRAKLWMEGKDGLLRDGELYTYTSFYNYYKDEKGLFEGYEVEYLKNSQEVLESQELQKQKEQTAKQRFWTRIAGVVAIVAIIASFFSYQQYNNANAANEKAVANAQKFQDQLNQNIKNQKIAKAKEIISYAESYCDIGEADFARQSYEAARDTLSQYPNEPLFLKLKQLIETPCSK